MSLRLNSVSARPAACVVVSRRTHSMPMCSMEPAQYRRDRSRIAGGPSSVAVAVPPCWCGASHLEGFRDRNERDDDARSHGMTGSR